MSPAVWLVRRVYAVTVVFALIAVVEALAATVDAISLGRDVDEGLYSTVGWAQTILFWVGVIALLAWMSAAYRSLEPARRRFSSGWAVGAWFVPFLNLWRPKQIMDDIAGGRTPLVTVWWVLFLLVYPVTSVVLRLIPEADWRAITVVYVCSEALAAFGAIVVIVVVRSFPYAVARLREAPTAASV